MGSLNATFSSEKKFGTWSTRLRLSICFYFRFLRQFVQSIIGATLNVDPGHPSEFSGFFNVIPAIFTPGPAFGISSI